MLIRALTIK